MIALVLAFAATNIDGFSCLGAAFAVNPPGNRLRAVLVATATFALLLAVALAGAAAMGRITSNAAWFGLLPAAIGVARLIRVIRGGRAVAEDDWLSSAPSILSIVLATGADNVAVYAPLFAVRGLESAVGICGVYLIAWAAGCALLAYAARDVSRLRALRRYLEPALAVLFIVIGVSIVAHV